MKNVYFHITLTLSIFIVRKCVLYQNASTDQALQDDDVRFDRWRVVCMLLSKKQSGFSVLYFFEIQPLETLNFMIWSINENMICRIANFLNYLFLTQFYFCMFFLSFCTWNRQFLIFGWTFFTLNCSNSVNFHYCENLLASKYLQSTLLFRDYINVSQKRL